MSRHLRAARPYRGGKRPVGTIVRDLSTPYPFPAPIPEHPVPAPGMPGGPGHLVDLAVMPLPDENGFNPNEPRDTKGRWTRAVGDRVSGIEQMRAQSEAERAFQIALRAAPIRPNHGREPFADHPDDCLLLHDDDPAFSWGMYQCQEFTKINDYLRNGVDSESTIAPGVTASQLAKGMDDAFDKMGYDVKSPITLFRGENQNHNLKASDFTVGEVWSDKAVISTSASPDEVAGYMQDANADNPFLLEIKVPKGTRVLGGYSGGVETMLKPGTKFKVLAVDQPTEMGGMSNIPTYHIPKITVEVVPS